MHNKNAARETPKDIFYRLFRELPNGSEYFQDGKIIQKKAAIYLGGVDQSVLSRWLAKPDAPPPKRVVECMVKKFNITPAHARGEIDIPQQALELSDTARGVARSYDHLPIPAQQFLAAQIDGLLDFRDKYPRTFDVMFKNVDSESYREFESQLERLQRRLRTKPKEPSKKP